MPLASAAMLTRSAVGKKTDKASLRDFFLGKKKEVTNIKSGDLTFIFRNLATLVQNGVSLPKALGTLAKEKGIDQYAGLLDGIRRRVETGESFSAALARLPHSFDSLMVNQIKVGERSGTMGETLNKIASQREKAGNLKAMIKKKLAYPVVLVVLGSGVITFMMMYVVPTFKKTYDSAGIPLPFITQFMITVSEIVKSYGWMIAAAVILSAVTIKRLRLNPHVAFKMDRAFLRLPLFGNWLRDIAVLQLMEVLGNLMEAGFTLAEALGESANSVGNRMIRKGTQSLQSAILRGEKLSHEIERHGEMFPPIVSQLVIIGEQTGKLANATSHIREHLRREIERKTGLMVGAIEPVLTISLASAIAVILLAIYLPMFDMINTVGG